MFKTPRFLNFLFKFFNIKDTLLDLENKDNMERKKLTNLA